MHSKQMEAILQKPAKHRNNKGKSLNINTTATER
jgi:hypothetical protein